MKKVKIQKSKSLKFNREKLKTKKKKRKMIEVLFIKHSGNDYNLLVV